MRFEDKIAETLGIDDEMEGVRLEVAQPEFPVANDDDVVFTKISDDKVRVSYLSVDSDPSNTARDFFDNDDGAGEFFRFRSQDEVEAKVAEAAEAGDVALVVNRFEHGQVHYSVRGSITYRYHEFDVAPSCVIIPCEDVQDAYRKAMKAAAGDPAAEKAAMDAMIKDSNSTLDEYSKVCNGEIYGVIHETWQASTDGRMEQVDSDACWGYVGYDYALETMKGEIPEAEQEPAPGM